ncbi:MAG: hypothetical protein GX962_09540 [Epulopiscium sp.]|nr:hypothetical protein [Candidatus Epulonipiscium sp.]
MIIIADNAAHIVKRINDIWGKKPGKKTLQKLVYLIQQKGINLNYDYGIHFYGPYSEKLDHAITSMSADGVIEFDYSGRSHLMGIKTEAFEVKPKELSEEQQHVIDDLITQFEGYSPSDLELLTTAIYAYEHLDDKSRASIINGVKKIKGSKYSQEQIEQSLQNFEYFNKRIAN